MIDAINYLDSPWNVVAWGGFILGIIILAWLLTRINKLIFKRIQKKHAGLNIIFLQHLISVAIVIGFFILVISSFSGFNSVWQSILGGTAVMSAVIAFAAQDVIRDILAGLMITWHHPFDIGDRIVLEDGKAGIVEDLTLRHVVILGVDTTRYVIPNSKINAMRITNMTFHRGNRSAEFEFSIGYNSDMTLAKTVIKTAIEESEYSMPGIPDKDGNLQYSKIYFMRFAESALILHATVYYENTIPSEVLIDDINVRVREALIKNNIEIPYNYVNVITNPYEKWKAADK